MVVALGREEPPWQQFALVDTEEEEAARCGGLQLTTCRIPTIIIVKYFSSKVIVGVQETSINKVYPRLLTSPSLTS